MDLSCPNEDQVFDEVRRCFVAATPEERVRQKIVKKMVQELAFPKEFIAVEKELKELPHLLGVVTPQRRVDILCYGKNIHPEHLLYPLLLIECKKQTIDAKAVAQVVGYNAFVKAYFIAIVNLTEELFGYLDKQTKQYVFYNGLPTYNQLLSCLN